MQSGLAKRLRLETRDLHSQAERAGIMPALLSGRLDRATYCALLVNLLAIYTALEASLTRHARHPFIAPLACTPLHRRSALEHDLHALQPQARHTPAVQAATGRYVSRLQQIDRAAPELLVAHAYVRYLGDLSGGQLLRRVIAAWLPADAANAVRFYDFGTPADAANAARRFRHGLDAAPVDARSAAAIVAEAQLAFDLHTQLFSELAEGRPRTT